MENCKCKPAKSLAEQVIEYREFVSLVAKMREAQKYRDMCSPEDYDNCSDADVYEFHVDEYLKKMEDLK
ncbi:MAG: hypothetical protein IJD91_09900 [Clostridia bacterium]|nr:hypothetical protein [Clostridia bacterium]